LRNFGGFVFLGVAQDFAGLGDAILHRLAQLFPFLGTLSATIGILFSVHGIQHRLLASGQIAMR
jgi:hypothetical protein